MTKRTKVEVAAPANAFVPRQTRIEARESLRAPSFSKDVSPFAKGVAIACTLLVFGSVSGLLILARNRVEITVFEAIGLGVLFAIACGGLAYGLMLLLMKEDFEDRQWSETEEITDHQPSESLEEQYVFIQIGNERSRFPDEPRVGAHAEFFKAVIDGSATFTQKGNNKQLGAKDFDYGNSHWQNLRNYFLRKKFAQWKDEKNTRLGLVMNDLGWETMEKYVAQTNSDLISS